MDEDLRKKLDERLVNGEIDKEEYSRILETLASSEKREPREAAPTGPSQPPRYQEQISWVPALVLYCVASGFAILADLSVMAGENHLVDSLLIPSCLVAIAATVLWAILHFRLWRALPVSHRVTTPARAVGFTFIPIFNFYWAFVTYPKLAEGINNWRKERELPELHELLKLALGYAGVWVGLWITFILPEDLTWLSLLISIAELVLFILLYKRLVEVVNEMNAKEVVHD